MNTPTPVCRKCGSMETCQVENAVLFGDVTALQFKCNACGYFWARRFELWTVEVCKLIVGLGIIAALIWGVTRVMESGLSSEEIPKGRKDFIGLLFIPIFGLMGLFFVGQGIVRLVKLAKGEEPTWLKKAK